MNCSISKCDLTSAKIWVVYDDPNKKKKTKKKDLIDTIFVSHIFLILYVLIVLFGNLQYFVSLMDLIEFATFLSLAYYTILIIQSCYYFFSSFKRKNVIICNKHG